MPVVYVLEPPIGAGSGDPDAVVVLPEAGLDAGLPAPVYQEWVMQANCSLSPGQLLMALGSVALASLTISFVFWWMGAPWVLPFACLEILGLLLAFVVYASRADDREIVRIGQGICAVECRRSGRVARVQWPTAWTQVSCGAATEGLIELAGGGHRVRVGRHLRPGLRPRVARAMQQALRGVQTN